jgi:hypothetical protein
MLGNFFSAKRAVSAPDQECLANGAKFVSQIRQDAERHLGEIWDEKPSRRWTYRTLKRRPRPTLQNPFNKPDFLIGRPETNEEVIIGRRSFFPPMFDVMRAGEVIGNIRMRSILRNKYSISIDGELWTFRILLFSVRCYGASDKDGKIWVAVGPSKRTWNILLKPGVREWPLLAALAFIHDEWWNYG